MTARLVVPFLPPRELSPNARAHWRTRWKANRMMREASFMLARAQQVPTFTKARIQITYVVKQRRLRDGDNGLAMAKGLIDGLVDAHVFKDDNVEHVSYAPVAFIVDRERAPMTIVEVEEAP